MFSTSCENSFTEKKTKMYRYLFITYGLNIALKAIMYRK